MPSNYSIDENGCLEFDGDENIAIFNRAMKIALQRGLKMKTYRRYYDAGYHCTQLYAGKWESNHEAFFTITIDGPDDYGRYVDIEGYCHIAHYNELKKIAEEVNASL